MKPSRKQLKYLYCKKRMTTRAIGEQFNTSKTSVVRWLKSFDIPRRASNNGVANRGAVAPSAEQLYQWVRVEHLSYDQISEMIHCDRSSIPYWLKKFGIPRHTNLETRRKGQNVTLPTETELRSLYESGLSLTAIGNQCGVSSEPIRRLCTEYGIEVRPDGWIGGKRLVCDDGHLVRSTYELRVDNWLNEHSIEHIYEPALPFDKRYHADFFARGRYIEIWGVKNSANYKSRCQRKRMLYAEHDLPLIQLYLDAFTTRRKGQWERQLQTLLD